LQESDSDDHECTDDDIPGNHGEKHTNSIHEEDSDDDVHSPSNEEQVYLLYFKYDYILE